MFVYVFLWVWFGLVSVCYEMRKERVELKSETAGLTRRQASYSQSRHTTNHSQRQKQPQTKEFNLPG